MSRGIVPVIPGSQRVTQGLLSGSALVVLMVGIPVALVVIGGSPIPPGLVHAVRADMSIHQMLRRQATGNWMVDVTLVLAWCAWLWLLICVVVELASWMSGRARLQLPGSKTMQAVAACLVGTTLTLTPVVRMTGVAAAATASRPVSVGLPVPAGPPVPVGSTTEVQSSASDPHFEQAASDSSVTSMTTYVVRSRDTLWSIATSELGSPLRWPEIARVNYGRPQPDGQTLTDAHWINPGWVLLLPTDVSVTGVVTTPSHRQVHDRSVIPESRSATGESRSINAGDRGGGHVGVPVVPIGAGLLGAGIVGLLDRMRRAQHRHRHPGEQIRLPCSALSNLERRLRTSDDPLAPYAVDAALRAFSSVALTRLHPAPIVAGVCVHPDEIELIPQDPRWEGTVPVPFETRSGSASWFVHRANLSLRGAAEGDPGPTSFGGLLAGPLVYPEHPSGDGAAEAPFPALVTVGRSDVGPCLVNLEVMGSLAISGDPDGCEGLMRALALELATSFWADQFDLVLVGFGEELSRFERVRTVSDVQALVGEVAHRARDGRALLHAAGLGSFAEARLVAGSDTWDVLVVLCAPTVPSHDLDELVELAADADAGIVIVGSGEMAEACHVLTVGAAGTSSPLDLLSTIVWPQQVGPTELEGLGQLVATASDLSSVPASTMPYASITAPVPRPRSERARDPEQAQSSQRMWSVETNRSDRDEIETGQTELGRRPEIEVAVLGPVEVRGAARLFTRVWAKELVVYLAMHPGGVSNETWATALWPDRLMAASSLHSTASVARRSLGQALDGGDHLPKGHGRLALSDTVRTDWDRFVQLADSDGPGWHQAMELVRGRPFDGLRASDWPILEGLSAAIEASVVDVASRLATSCISRGDAAGAEWAARKGLLVSPYDERLYRMLLRAADLAGNPAGVEAVMSELVHLVADGVEPFDSVHPETSELYRSLSRRRSLLTPSSPR